jgi:hypothetical protein
MRWHRDEPCYFNKMSFGDGIIRSWQPEKICCKKPTAFVPVHVGEAVESNGRRQGALLLEAESVYDATGRNFLPQAHA